MTYRKVTFCSHLKYFGSWVSFSLRDNHNVAKRIASVNASMGAMVSFLDDDNVECVLQVPHVSINYLQLASMGL